MTKMSKKRLLGLYANQQLTDSLKGLNAIELAECQSSLKGYSLEERIILEGIITELAYREENPILATRYIKENMTDEEITNATNYNKVARTVSQDEAVFTENYLSLLGIDTGKLSEKFPIALSVRTLSKLYGFLSKSGLSDEDVEDILTCEETIGSYQQLLKSADKRGLEETLTEDSFKKFVIRVAKNLKLQTQKQSSIQKIKA